MLDGVRVLSFTHFLQGPSAVQMLADAGADVIKIEPPNGAWERHWAGRDAFVDGVSVFFMLGNRNQRSLSLDLRSEEGKTIARRLVSEADVLVENYRPGVMKKLELDYETLRELNPGLIYCSLTGYGSSGPYVERPGQDLLLQAMSGLAMLNGEGDGPPVTVGSAIVDQHAAVLAAFGILAALIRRQKTGKGCLVESNLLNAALDLQIEPFIYHMNMGDLWPRTKPGMGSRFHPAPYGIYKTADGWIAISLSEMPVLANALDDLGFTDFSKQDQTSRREEINQRVTGCLVKQSTDYWIKKFEKCGLWFAPVNDYEAVQTDPQVQQNQVILEVVHPEAGPIKVLNHPVRYDGKPLPLRRSPPMLGEHTVEILQESGFSAKEIDDLLARTVVRQGKTR